MSGWLQLVACLALPYLLPKVYRLFVGSSNKPSLQRRAKPRSLADNCSGVGLLLLAAVFIYVGIFHRQYDLLTAMHVPDTASSYEMRGLFKAYMAAHFPEWPDLSAIAPQLKPAAQAAQDLFEELRSSDTKRLHYAKYGSVAVTSCTWCKTPEDYAFGASATIMSHYVLFLVWFGLGTMVWRKHPARTWAATACGVMACVDVYVLFLSSGLLLVRQETLFPILSDSQFNQMHTLRYAAFSCLALIAGLIDAAEEWTDREILAELVQKTMFNYARLDATALAREAALGDDDLRKSFVQYFSAQTKVGDGVSKTATNTGAAHLKDLMKGYSIARVIHEQDAVQSFMRLAMNESFLSGIDLPPPIDPLTDPSLAQASAELKPTLIQTPVEPEAISETPIEKKQK
ncbi:hypothetical protein BASA50_005517 [Batrachochytrium salamandrivorans]|uniref:RGS domain-containing protein n=1 Tax=Batrachochytrium salamandrivorans TaxID=1357716 RepID=A0ABQ8FCK8_9FUNG|nr:hypothetical protein BASA60_005023 [Batrachochytrium salamandrivorans]KAH6577752.1 hypothetical protein BASA62_000733 [Batrachochytrium salamandrivorans]KAH6584850.1 hypothetical protein BASA61_007218 [Batrachochytrium salamandrivorans]KAH6595937.1 hypothetical protein BASA50_005517 [Batrachochytrium salamandrivorans]KAH9248070.1 hypothetical protein BASA81_014303 [Batrachochytrium salamandrivorans]